VILALKLPPLDFSLDGFLKVFGDEIMMISGKVHTTLVDLWIARLVVCNVVGNKSLSVVEYGMLAVWLLVAFMFGPIAILSYAVLTMQRLRHPDRYGLSQ
jgi:hypothetical protein